MTINFKELRSQRRKWDTEQTSTMPFKWPIVVILTLFILYALYSIAYADNSHITDIQAVRAILGEAENEPFNGKVAIGEVIRTRGSMKGIYGYNAVKYVNGRYYRGKRAISPTIALQALKAWRASISTNYALNAQGWGSEADLRVFKRQSWFKNCYVTVKLGNHYFWKVKKGA